MAGSTSSPGATRPSLAARCGLGRRGGECVEVECAAPICRADDRHRAVAEAGVLELCRLLEHQFTGALARITCAPPPCGPTGAGRPFLIPRIRQGFGESWHPAPALLSGCFPGWRAKATRRRARCQKNVHALAAQGNRYPTVNRRPCSTLRASGPICPRPVGPVGPPRRPAPSARPVGPHHQPAPPARPRVGPPTDAPGPLHLCCCTTPLASPPFLER